MKLRRLFSILCPSPNVHVHYCMPPLPPPLLPSVPLPFPLSSPLILLLFLFQNLPPVQAIIHTPCSSKQFLVAMAVQSQKLIPLIRNGTLSSLKIFLDALSTTEIESCLKEQTHGGCNILHLLAALSAPSPPVPQTTTSSSGSARSRTGHPGLREMMHQALNLPTSSLSGRNIYMYMYICTYRHTCTCTCIHTCTYMYMYIYIHTCIHTCTYIHTYMYMYIHTCTCTYIHVHVHTYMYIHTYILTDRQT